MVPQESSIQAFPSVLCVVLMLLGAMGTLRVWLGDAPNARAE